MDLYLVGKANFFAVPVGKLNATEAFARITHKKHCYDTMKSKKKLQYKAQAIQSLCCW